MSSRPSLTLFAHSGAWDHLYQVAALAVTAAAQGREVTVALQFFALQKWVEGRWEEKESLSEEGAEAEALRTRLAGMAVPGILEMLALARETGSLKMVACSGSVAMMGLDAQAVHAVCDDVSGLATLLARAEGGQVIYL